MKPINFVIVKKFTYYVKRQEFLNFFYENCAFYGLDTEPEPEP